MMKRFLFFLSFISILHAQVGVTIYVDGNKIMGPCGDELILKGVNYAPYNWGYSPSQLRISQIAMTGANCIRLPWYASGSPTLYTDYVMLDSALSKCIQNDIIPILELHDETCQNDSADIISLATWFTSPNMLTLINKYKHSLIINIANEALYVNWTANPVAARQRFKNTYIAAIDIIRDAGVTVPIMVDGPDCGTNLDVLASIGNDIQLADAVNNTIFSAHAYWYAFASNDSTTMSAKINNAITSGIPFVFGEIANYQDDATLCQYDLEYEALLKICEARNIGWIAWSWDNDGCSSRQMSTDGAFANLSTYGNDIVNNTEYGMLTNIEAKSEYLVNNGCAPNSAIDETDNQLIIYPNPTKDAFSIRTELVFNQIIVQDISGKTITQFQPNTNNVYQLNNLQNGIYLINLLTDKKVKTQKIIINK